MIAKHVPMKSVRKSDFAGLVKYLIDEPQKRERVTGLSVTNCLANQTSVPSLNTTVTAERPERETERSF